MLRRLHVLPILLLLLALPAGAQEPFKGFDQYVAGAMKLWQVPGLAIALIKDGKVVYAKGYGTRTLGQNEPVDDRTLFAIGSSSKAFTVAALGMLVDEKKVAWDDRVDRHLPMFRMFDPYASHEMTIRDMLSHRSGLVRGDLLWYGTDLDRTEIVRRIRYLEPSWSFRSRFGYQNLMFLTAGQLLTAVTGTSWEDFVARRLFAPLGMTATNTSTKALVGKPNVASPHAELNDTVRAVPYRNIDNIGPAGSINSNVVDMAQWVRLHLNDGELDGTRLLSSAVVQQMQTPTTIIPLEGVTARLASEANFQSYGMGWFLQDHRGRKIVHHGGNIDGMSALVAMLPSEKAGLVILTNLNGTSLPTALMYRVFDAWLGAPAKDWSGEMHAALKPLLDQAKAQQKKVEADRVKGTSPSHALADYTGKYLDPDSLYGQAEIRLEGGGLMASYGVFQGPLEHWHYDTFRGSWTDPMAGKSLLTFNFADDGKVSEVRIQGIGTFNRQPELVDTAGAVELSEADLRALVGRYQSDQPPVDLSVEFVDGYLQAVLPGQPAYRMAAQSTTMFKLTGIPIVVTVEFKKEGGEVVSAELKQQGFTFDLKRQP